MQHRAITIFLTFFKLGLTSFGGPIAHLGYFRKELVEKQQWLEESSYAQLLAICQFLPGPASSQLGFAIGLLRGGFLGACAAFVAFTLPSAVLLIAFAAWLPYMPAGVEAPLIHGLKLVACAVVADAVLKMGQTLCTDNARKGIALLTACGILLMSSTWGQLALVLGCALLGMVICRTDGRSTEDHALQVAYGPRLAAAFLLLFGVLLVCALMIGEGHRGLTSIGAAFYPAGAMVFGGGHVVLPLLEERIVGQGWLAADQFIAGYGASQAIPGPMFAFSAYLGYLIPTESGQIASAMVALLFMFLPGFLLILGVLPLWQAVARQPQLARCMAGVNAAVVGLLAAALYDPIFLNAVASTTDFIIVLIGWGILAIWRLSPLYVVLWCVVASWLSV